MEQQTEQFREVSNPHDLPEIFHYWSNKYVRPRLNSVCGADNIFEFFANAFFAAAKSCASNSPRFLSIGTGDCSVEVGVAKRLKEMGLSNFLLECLESSSEAANRTAAQARADGAGDIVFPIVADLNNWQPTPQRYCAVMSHHALHHLL